MKEKKYTTGQFAKLCGTTKDTIYYYLEEGLLQAEVSDENGYRYFRPDQYFEYMMIHMLRECDCSISEIQTYLQKIGPRESVELLRKKREDLSQKMEHLARIHDMISGIIDETDQALQITDQKPYIANFPEMHFFETAASDNFTTADAAAIEINEHINHCIRCGFRDVFSLRTILSEEGLREGKYIQTHIISRISENRSIPHKIVFPSNTYAVINHFGGYDEQEALVESLHRLLQFIKEEGYEIAGDGFATDIVGHIASSRFENFVIQICIPVRAAE